MARELNGAELAGFIKERQAYQIRNLKQQFGVQPKLVILMSEHAGDVIEKYVSLKQAYASDILIEVEVSTCSLDAMPAKITELNSDATVHGVIVQLPLDDPSKTDEIVNNIAPEKDVDGLGVHADFVSATAEAIDWLLAGYNVDLKAGKIAIIGRGRLVGAPLEKMWSKRGLAVTALDEHSKDTRRVLNRSSIIISAAGVPRLVTSEMVPKQCVVVDAGTVSENGQIVGDIDDSVRERQDVSLTPKIGGVGPMTVCVMFDHVIQAALKTTKG